MGDWKKYLNEYVFDTVLPGTGKKLEFKPITTGQMKRLLSFENEKNPGVIEDALDEILKECVITKGFKPEDLYINDRFFLLIEIRKYTKGTVYQFDFTCPKCESQSLQTVDLKKLKVKKLPKKINNIVKLDNNISVKLDFPKRKNQKEAYKVMDIAEEMLTNLQQTAELGTVLTASTIQSIITPDGEDKPDMEDKLYFLDNITQEMYEEIANWTTKDFGVDFKVMIKCPHVIKEKEKDEEGNVVEEAVKCDFASKVDIPPENFFF